MIKKIKHFDDGGSSDGGDGGGSSYAFSGGFGDGAPSESDVSSYNAGQAQLAAENAAKAAGTYQGLGWSAPSNESSPYGNLGWNSNQTVYTTPEGQQLTDISAPVAQVQADTVAPEMQAQTVDLAPLYSSPGMYGQFGMPSGQEALAPQIAGPEQSSLAPKEEGGFLDGVKKYLSNQFSPQNLPLTLLSFLPGIGPLISVARLFSGLANDPNKTIQDTATRTAGGVLGQMGSQALGGGLPGLVAGKAISSLTQSELNNLVAQNAQEQMGAGLKSPTFTTSDAPDYGLTTLYQPGMPSGTVVGELDHPSLNLGDLGKTVNYGSDSGYDLGTNYDQYGLKYTPKAPIYNETYGINAAGIPLGALGQELASDYSLSNEGDVFSALAGRSSPTSNIATSTYTPLSDYSTGSGYVPSKALYGKDINKEALKPQVLAASKAAKMKSPLEVAAGGAIPHMSVGSSTTSSLDTLLNPYKDQTGSSTKPSALAAQMLSPSGSAKIQPLGVSGFQFSPIQRFSDGGHPLTGEMVDAGVHSPEFMSEGGMHTYVQGGGTGTSDSVPAMLATGEFVLPADVVSGLGDGSNEAGAKILDEFMRAIRKHKRSTDPSELPPDSKGPLAYLAEAASATVKRGKK